ncbi:MAG: type II secretion system F family protein [Deltaproteobacteria bacterium]|nr:MAG: type II secretion system F family protein [Deltaproteobacteria bacterium]
MTFSWLTILIGILVFASVGLLSYAGAEVFGKGFRRYEEKYLSRASQELDEMFLPFSAEQIFYLNILSVLAFLILGFLLTRSFILAICLGGLGFFLPRIALNMAKQRRREKFDIQLVDGLATISNSLKAGLSLVQAIEVITREASPPLKEEFGLMLRELTLGVELEKALNNLADRVKSMDLDLVVTSINIVRGTGGNLSEMFDQIADTIRERNTLKGKISSLTAQGRLQGIVIGSLPLVLGVILYFLEPRMIARLFTEPLGWGIIAIIIVFEGIGALFIRKIVNIDI